MNLSISDLWNFLVWGYLLTIALETPVLLAFLSRRHSWSTKLLASFWLTACTYPIVILVLPAVFFGSSRFVYLTVAEIFAPVAECMLFWLAFRGKGELSPTDWVRSLAAIVAANLASFGFGEIMNSNAWFGLF